MNPIQSEAPLRNRVFEGWRCLIKSPFQLIYLIIGELALISIKALKNDVIQNLVSQVPEIQIHPIQKTLNGKFVIFVLSQQSMMRW